MASLKPNLLILITFAIILISGGFIIWSSFGQEIVDRFVPSPTPTPNPYAGWQTYTNEEYGFSIKYPGDWYDNGGNNTNYTFSTYKIQIDLDPMDISIGVNNVNNYIYELAKNMTFGQLYEKLLNKQRNESTDVPVSKFGNSIKYTKIDQFNVGDLIIIRTRVTPGVNWISEDFDTTNYILLKGNAIISFSLSNTPYAGDIEVGPIITNQELEQLHIIAEKMVKSLEFFN